MNVMLELGVESAEDVLIAEHREYNILHTKVCRNNKRTLH